MAVRRRLPLAGAVSAGRAVPGQPAAEVSAEQDVDEGVDAAGGVAQADGQVVAGVVGQRGPAHRQVDQLHDVVGSHAQQEHRHQHQHHLGQADGARARQVGAVAVGWGTLKGPYSKPHPVWVSGVSEHICSSSCQCIYSSAKRWEM